MTCRYKYCLTFSNNGQCTQCLNGYDVDLMTGYCKIKFCLNFDNVN